MSIILILCTSNLYYQQVKTEGHVFNKKGNSPIANASVQLSHLGCTTNNSGDFSLMVDKALLDKNNLTCSNVGYITRSIIGKNIKGKVLIEMEDTAGTLPEIMIAISAKKIIEKAIIRIGINYPDKPFILSGVLRLAFEQDNGYRYNNDAFIEVYTPSYKKSNSGNVRLIKNKVDIKMG